MNTTMSGAAATSLVRSSKKSTLDISDEIAAIAREGYEARADALAERLRAPDDLAPLDIGAAGRWVRLSCENWRAIARDDVTGALYTPIDPEEAPRRAALVTEGKQRPEPPRHYGDRWTVALSKPAAVKIENATLYSHRMGRGFRCFATLTLNDAARAQLRAWDFMQPGDNFSEFGPVDPRSRRSLGAMVRDFLKVLKQGWSRGMVLNHHETGEKVGRIRGHDGPLVFAWVAECPLNDEGQPNPHVHLMMNWTVQKKHFRAWAAWMERNWPGFVKLEKLRQPKSAAAYMAKAAKYIAKGQDGSQGAIRGNRYGIATEARAPAARRLGTFYADFLKQAVTAMQEARDKLKKSGLWAGAWAFGANNRTAWGRLWCALRRDGFRFDPAPPSLCAVSLENTLRAHQRTERTGLAAWIMEARAWCDETWQSFLNFYDRNPESIPA